MKDPRSNSNSRAWSQIALVMLFSIILTACSSQPDIQPVKTPDVVGLSNSGLDYQQYTGQAVIETYNPHAIVARFRHLGTDTTTRIIVFQTKKPLSNNFRTEFKNAEIVQFQHAFYIRDADSQNKSYYRLFIDDEHGRENSTRLENDLKISVGWNFSGIGLAYQTGKWLDLPSSITTNSTSEDLSTLFETLRQFSTEAKHDDPVSQNLSSCSSGGPGATSCSVTPGGAANCSVSCAQGFYACCAPYSCTCKTSGS
jgi:hypothetical protein